MSVLNPQTNRMVKIGSNKYKQLVRRGIIIENKDEYESKITKEYERIQREKKEIEKEIEMEKEKLKINETEIKKKMEKEIKLLLQKFSTEEP